MNTLIEILSTNVWPLSFLFITLVIMRQLRNDLSPIFQGMTATLAQQSQKNAMEWSLMLLTALLSSLQAIQEIAQQQHWVWLMFGAKALQPGLGVIVAIGNRMLNKLPPPPAGGTTPPMPIQQ